MLRIVSDTTTGFTYDEAARYGIDLVSQVVMFGSDVLRDGIDISNDVFMQRLRASKEFPKTSQPPVGDFVEVFKKRLDAGDGVLCITVSSALSGTYNSAEQARQQMGPDAAARITILDSKTVAAAEALMVLEAARLAKEGRSAASIVAALQPWVDGMTLDFALDTLEYLVRGGRASSLQGFFGTLLQVKPLLTIRNGTGRIEGLERVRTRTKALARLKDIVHDAVNGHGAVRMAVVHTGLPGEADALAQEFRQKYRLAECPVIEMPPAVAAHAGPGALGAAYYVGN